MSDPPWNGQEAVMKRIGAIIAIAALLAMSIGVPAQALPLKPAVGPHFGNGGGGIGGGHFGNGGGGIGPHFGGGGFGHGPHFGGGRGPGLGGLVAAGIVGVAIGAAAAAAADQGPAFAPGF
jgi:hypothetical protein